MEKLYKSISNVLNKGVKVILIACLLLSFGVMKVSAEFVEGQSLKDKDNASEVDDSKLKKMNINQADIEKSSDLKFFSEYGKQDENFDKVHFEQGKDYWIKYKEAFSSNGQSVDMKITIKRNDGFISDIVEPVNYIYLVDSSVPSDPNDGGDMPVNSVFLYTATANIADESHKTWISNNHVTVKYEFFKAGTNEPIEVDGLVGLLDVDGSNYLFDNTKDRNIFYTVKPEEHGIPGDMTEKYKVYSNGIKRSDQAGAVAQGISYWLDATLAIELRQDSSFTINFDVLSERIKLPILYEPVSYKITYDLQGGTIEEGNPTEYKAGEEKEVTINPEKVGFTFDGWSRKDTEKPDLQDKIVEEDRGDKEFVANWTPIEYKLAYDKNNEKATGTMENQTVTVRDDNDLHTNEYELTGYKFRGWTVAPGEQESVDYLPSDTLVDVKPDEVVGKEKDSIVKTLFAQWEPIKYTVKYDSNEPKGKTATGEMSDQTNLIYDEEYNLNKNKYAIEGYEFLGWSTTPGVHDVTHQDEQDFINLTAEDGGVVTMYAQWEPWKYNIYYDANGGEGTMNTQTFHFTDDSMVSSENQFYRNGFEFMGFEYQVNGSKYFITTPSQFRDILVSLGKNSSVTLVAIWKEIPASTTVKTYTLPVTGVE